MAERRVDWSFGPGHGPISGVVNAALGAAGATMVADLAHTPPLWGLVGGTVAAAGATIASVAQDAPGSALVYRAMCWVGAGSWSAWALATATSEPFSGPWSTPALAALAVGTVGAAMTGQAFKHANDKAEAERQDAVVVELERLRAEDDARSVASEHDRIAVEWRRRIARVCHVELEQGEDRGIVGVKLWDGDPCPGFTIDGNCPPGGTSWRTLQRFEEELAADAGLLEGCSAKIKQGAHRGAFLIDVMTRNVLAEEKVYPAEYPHESINEPRLLSYTASDQEVRVSLRQETMLIVGPTGTGKTTTVNDVIAEHLKCVDVISCVIDFNGGSLAIPWLMPWRADPGGCPRPPISWVADTPEKALEMTEGILDVIKDRKQAYAHLKVANNTTLLPISAEIPQFTIFIDEVAEILGSGALRNPVVRKVADNVLEIQRIGRDSGGRLIISSLGDTIETLGSTSVVTNAKVKMAMGGTPMSILGRLFDDYKMSAEDAIYPGTAHTKIHQATPFLTKVPNLLPNQLSDIAKATSDRRCDPDERALKVLGDRWTRRWDNSHELLTLLDAGVEALRNGESMAAAVSMAAPAVRSGGDGDGADAPAGGAGTRRDDTPSLADAMTDLEAAKSRLQNVDPVPDPGSSESELPPLPRDADFSVVESWLVPGTPATDATGKRKPLPKARMRQLVWDAGDAGIGPTAVHKALESEGYGTTYQTVNGWMKSDAQAGILDQAGDRAPYTRGPKMTDPYAAEG